MASKVGKMESLSRRFQWQVSQNLETGEDFVYLSKCLPRKKLPPGLF